MKSTDTTQEFLKKFWEQQYEEKSEFDSALVKKLDQDLAETSPPESHRDIWIKILKGTFLFLPGAWLLFMVTSFMTYAFFSGWFGMFEVFLSMPWLLLYGFMVMFGIGDIKNPKHLSLPITIGAVSLVVGVISFLIEGVVGSLFLPYYSIYLMPLIFSIPFLVRSFIDKPEP